MASTAIRNNRGFTLVEVLVTMVILACGLLGSLVGIISAMDYNFKNTLRNEAIKIAQEQAEAARNRSYATIQNMVGTQTVQRQIRKTLANFQMTTATSPITKGSQGITQLSVTVQWTFKNKTYSYLLISMVRQLR